MAKLKNITIRPELKRDQRKLEKLLNGGWEIISQHRRGALDWHPYAVDITLKKG